jgi:hypothetical protein
MRPTTTSIDDVFAQRLETLDDFVRQLHQSINARNTLSNQVLAWLAEQYDTTKQKLLFLYAWHFPTNPIVEQRRNNLEHTLDNLLEQERQEEVTCWRDTELLHKELRHWKKQHQDLEQRLTLLKGNSV